MKKSVFAIAFVLFAGVVLYLFASGKFIKQISDSGTTPVPQTNATNNNQLQALIAAANLQLTETKLAQDAAYQNASLDIARQRLPSQP